MNTKDRTALVYATFDGITSAHSGIGTQTKAFLHEIAVNRAILDRHDIARVFAAYPATCPTATGYEFDEHAHSVATGLLEQSDAHGWPLDWHAEEFWSESAWHQMCRALAARIESIADLYDRVIVLAVDAVYLRLSAHLVRLGSHIQLVHLWYSSVLVTGMTPNPDRLAAERWCIEQVNSRHAVHIADVGEFFTAHLRRDFGLSAEPLRFPHSLSLTSPDYTPLSSPQVDAVLAEHRIPRDLPIIAFAGRVDPVKGLDILIDELQHVDRPFRLVALTSPNHRHDPNMTAITRRLAEIDYAHTLIPHFDRQLYRALSCCGDVTAIVCPSRGEPIGAVPQETALLAANGGPIVIASDRDGLAEQIRHTRTGLLFDPDRPGALAAEITTALDMSTKVSARIRAGAARKVRAERCMGSSLDQLLTELAQGTPQSNRIDHTASKTTS
ncbi:glycosyltransferase (plasmid) [Nocardia sp. NBC_01377]|uniref:glycosyltransferase n=1 Tax=Nocardia sp. NBC_01377 TaxID=2903595 RepID=UPI002F910978